MIRSEIVILCLSSSLMCAQMLPAIAETSRSHQSISMQFIRVGLLDRDAHAINAITLPGITKTILGDRTVVERLEAATKLDWPDSLDLTSIHFATTDDSDTMLALTRRLEAFLFPSGKSELYEHVVQNDRMKLLRSLGGRTLALAEFTTVRDGNVYRGYLLISTEDVGGKPMVASMKLR